MYTGDAGTALMGIGRGSGRSRAQEAAASAISSPLLDFPIEKAKGVVFNIVGGNDLTLQEVIILFYTVVIKRYIFILHEQYNVYACILRSMQLLKSSSKLWTLMPILFLVLWWMSRWRER